MPLTAGMFSIDRPECGRRQYRLWRALCPSGSGGHMHVLAFDRGILDRARKQEEFMGRGAKGGLVKDD